MEISPVASTQVYFPSQDAGQGKGSQSYAEAAFLARQNTDSTQRENLADPKQLEAEKAAVCKRETEAARGPGIRFEYENSHKVMKVHNMKGALIYQVPSKGQLALIEANDIETEPLLRASA